MKRYYIPQFCLGLVFLTASCSKKVSENKIANEKSKAEVPSGFVPQGYKLSFNDEFEGKSLDITKWDYRLAAKIGGGYSSNQLEDNVSINNGVLLVKGVFKDPKAGGINSGGGVISKAHFRYGYYESRVKTQDGPFWHSSFWTYNTKDKTRATEIDVFERDSEYDKPDGIIKIRQNVIQHSSGKPITLKGSIKLPLNFDPSADYHIYGMLWEENQVTFYIDGKLTNTISYPASKYPHDDTAIWLSMIARNTATANTACYFDYVRFYSKTN
ncbi:glycoside hydrolase family 16 protein [Pedobacter cryophilus]|uniref:Glycosyl hydrolase family protein n=1 Tax=Pedobacter cryophilus TaxID=2571271 RepID=A0A4U1BX32_9SPHI|nr:glycoside hydrolase family 16 protein [Pedobacter cryophilus]TKB96891.1 glycosyl hydrolase family protein [Pedobacter cryophilus]